MPVPSSPLSLLPRFTRPFTLDEILYLVDLNEPLPENRSRKVVLSDLVSVFGRPGPRGPGVYEDWLNNGNTGSFTTFLESISGREGVDGDSAFQSWLNVGNDGTEADFVDSLKGLSAFEVYQADGNPTATLENYYEFIRGPRGYDNYELAVQNGFVGTLDAYLASLKGVDAYEDWVVLGNSGTRQDFIDSLKGEPGTVTRGDKGDPGPGVATGGVAGQFLKKTSSVNYATAWAAIRELPSGGSAYQTVILNDQNTPVWASATLPRGGSQNQLLQKNSTNDYDAEWVSTTVLPVDGTSGSVPVYQEDGSVIWVSGASIPTGGTVGQAIVKTGTEDYEIAWGTVSGNSLPAGGTIHQVLRKTNNSNYAVEWATLLGLPTDAQTNQVVAQGANGPYWVTLNNATFGTLPTTGNAGATLLKSNNTTHEAQWAERGFVPSGGSTAQMLVKVDNTNFNTTWADIPIVENGEPGVGVPTGGQSGEALVKVSNDDYDTAWTQLLLVPASIEPVGVLQRTGDQIDSYAWAPLEGLLPEGGTLGQTIFRTQDGYAWGDIIGLPDGGTLGQTIFRTNDGYAWGTPATLPTGGNENQVLAKASGNDYDTAWTTLAGIPSGGDASNVLVKSSNTDYDAAWVPGSSILGFTPVEQGGVEVYVKDAEGEIIIDPETNAPIVARDGFGRSLGMGNNKINLGWAANARSVLFSIDRGNNEGQVEELLSRSNLYVNAPLFEGTLDSFAIYIRHLRSSIFGWIIQGERVSELSIQPRARITFNYAIHMESPIILPFVRAFTVAPGRPSTSAPVSLIFEPGNQVSGTLYNPSNDVIITDIYVIVMGAKLVPNNTFSFANEPFDYVTDRAPDGQVPESPEVSDPPETPAPLPPSTGGTVSGGGPPGTIRRIIVRHR